MPSIKPHEERRRLTDRLIASLKTEREREDLFDHQVSGLILRVTRAGKKSWALRYRTADGRQPRLTLGTYPAMGLADARDAAMEAQRSAQKGGDPASEKRRAKEQARAQVIRTFNDLADAYVLACERGEWMPKGKKKRPRTLADDRAVNRRYVQPVIGKMRLEEITRPLVKKLLRDLVARGINAQANRTHAFIRQAYAYAIGEFEGRLVEVNPATGFSPLGKAEARARVLTDAEMRLLWMTLARPGALKAIDDEGAESAVAFSRSIAIALQLNLLLLQRKGEIAGMRTGEIDLEHCTWLIPGERMKNGRPHLVPLTPRAVELIREALELATSAPEDEKETDDLPVFPSPRDPAKSVRADSVDHAMRKIVAALKMPRATPHDLRRTGSTVMTSERLGIAPFIRSKVLAHTSDTGGGAAVSSVHYDANIYVAEKRRALAAWDSLLLEIVGERTRPNNVKELRADGAAGRG